jgi:hypothetical protein
VIAIVGTGARARLEPVDARTLAPLPGTWSVRVPIPGLATLSPSGKKVAVETHRTLVVDTATGKVEHRYEFAGDTSSGLYWFDRNDARPFLVGVGFDCGSTGVGSCGAELSTVGYGPTDDSTYGGTEAGPAIQQGLVLIYNPTAIDVYHDGATDIPIDLPKMPPSAPFDVVADVAHNRLFAISSAGLVAEIDYVGQVLACSDCISYHTVDLNGQSFAATWAGSGKIALWGQDGLGTIDTRTWTTQAVAANTNITGVLATPFGLAAWTDNRADGLAVYRSDGSKRLQVLIGTPIRTVDALGNFLYVNAGRYSVDLRNGKVFGPIKTRATVVTPTLVPIP